MSNVDKTVRIGVDSSGASQGINNIRQEADKANASSVEGLKEQIRLIKQKGSLEEEFARKKIRNTQEDTRYAERELQLWKLQREEQSRGLRGEKRKRFDTATSEEETAARRSILQDKGTLADLRGTAEDEKSYRKKQLTLLQEQLETQKINKPLFERVLSGMGGGGGGLINAIGGSGAILASGVAAAAFMLVSKTEAEERGIRRYSQNIRQNPSAVLANIAFNEDFGESARVSGKSTKDFLEQNYARYQIAYGNANLRGGMSEGRELAGAERLTGMTTEQTSQALALSRYSGASATGQISMMENYLNKTGQSLVRLPEIMSTYLSTANGILQKTGSIDPLMLERTIQSIGSSYGAQGINLDRMTSGMQQVGSLSGNKIVQSIQMQVLRELYPQKSTFERYAITQDPLRNLEYVSGVLEKLKKLGPGSEWMIETAFPGAFSARDILDRIMPNKLTAMDLKPLAEDYYSKRSPGVIGGAERTSADLKDMGNAVAALPSKILDDFNKILANPLNLSNIGNAAMDNPFFVVLGKILKSAFSDSLKENKHILSK